jgi:hypothetical protein
MRKKNRVLAFIENTLVYFRFAQTCLLQDWRRESNKIIMLITCIKTSRQYPPGMAGQQK